MDYYSALATLPSVVELPVASCYFETLHKRSVPIKEEENTSSISINDLINAPSKVEPLLDQLSMDQIFNIEQTLKKIKKRKAKQINHYHDNNTLSSSSTYPKKKKPCVNPTSISQSGPPAIEVRDGIEWVSFVYSHNRVLKRYTIRTDIDDICLENIDVQFQLDNCVYPRANVPKENYQGNRWNYETQCNMLGWKLSWANRELAGKRGLIQRAVDFYRNRTPTMRSRRVARQARLLDGTLKKRKSTIHQQDLQTNKYDVIPNIPKTMTMEDDHQERIRVKITLDQVNVNDIDMEFRLSNCVYPRAMKYQQLSSLSDIHQQEAVCNELGWKLSWLNPQLTCNKNLLQRALDLYRIKFMPSFAPRKRSSRTPPDFSAKNTNNNNNNTSLTTNINDILLQQQQNINHLKPELDIINFNDVDAIKHIEIQHSSTSPTLSFTTGTTESLDFGDCLSINSDDNHHHYHSPIPNLWTDEIMDSCDLASIATLSTSLSSSTSSNSTTTDNSSLLCTPNSSPIHTMTPSQLIDDSFLFKNDSFDFSLLDTNMLIPPIMFNDDDDDDENDDKNSNNYNRMELPSVTVTNFNNNNTDTIDFNSFDQDLMLKMEESANFFSLF